MVTPGFDKRFLYPLLKRHECPICLLAMRDPVQTECGHLFCRGCLEPVLSKEKPLCPLDYTPLNKDDVSASCLIDFIASFGFMGETLGISWQCMQERDSGFGGKVWLCRQWMLLDWTAERPTSECNVNAEREMCGVPWHAWTAVISDLLNFWMCWQLSGTTLCV